MDKILFLSPPVKINSDVDVGLKHLSPNIGLAYVATFLKHSGFDVRVIDAHAENMDVKAIKKEILDFGPSFVCITSSTMLVRSAHQIAAMIKNEISKNITIIIGGYHATACPKRTLEEFPHFDFLIFGEGEFTLHELIRALIDKKPVEKIKGVGFRENGEARLTELRERIDDLDKLPFPDWNLFRLEKYTPYESGNSLELPICSSRGCPYQCIFCARPLGNRVVMRSVNSVINEMKRDLEMFGAGQIIFTDETFTLDRNRTIHLCDRMISEGLHEKVKWICETRADKVDLEMLKKLKEAGCSWINYGIDSGNDEILKKISKGHTVQDSRNAVRCAKEAGLKCCGSFILGHPYETLKTMTDTVNFSRELDLDFAAFSILTPYPGTKVAEMAESGVGDIKILTYDWDKYGRHVGNALSLKNFSRRDLERLQFSAYLKFFMRPSKIGVLLKKINLSFIPIYLVHQIKNSVMS